MEPDCTTIGVTPNTDGGTFGFTTPFIIIVKLQTRITAKMQHSTAPTMNRILFDVLLFAIRQSSKRVFIYCC